MVPCNTQCLWTKMDSWDFQKLFWKGQFCLIYLIWLNCILIWKSCKALINSFWFLDLKIRICNDSRPLKKRTNLIQSTFTSHDTSFHVSVHQGQCVDSCFSSNTNPWGWIWTKRYRESAHMDDFFAAWYWRFFEIKSWQSLSLPKCWSDCILFYLYFIEKLKLS